jgi:death-on-curing protein
MIKFLTLSEVLEILKDQILNYGGRDINSSSSAVYMPESSFGGKYLHETIPAMVAAYAFYICQNHPFIDSKDEILYNEIMNVANGKIKKES